MENLLIDAAKVILALIIVYFLGTRVSYERFEKEELARVQGIALCLAETNKLQARVAELEKKVP